MENETNPVEPKQVEPKTDSKHKMKQFVMIGFVVIAFAFFAYAAGMFFMERNNNSDNTKVTSPNVNKVTEPVVAVKSASVTYVKGDVTYTADESSDPVVLDTTIKTTLAEGGMIKTGSDSLAIITLADQSILRLNSDTEVVLTKMGATETTVTNSMGEVYARVASSSKSFNTVVDDTMFTSLGTAYKSVNTDDVKSVDVYEGSLKKTSTPVASSTSSKDKFVLGEEEVIISQGYRYYLKYKNHEDKEDSLEKLTQEEVTNNEFARWNMKEDLRNKNYADKLGVLDDLIGQYVAILTPQDGFETKDKSISIKGRADTSFNLTLNGKELKNNNGEFEAQVDLVVGKNEFEVVGTIGVEGYSVSDSVTIVRMAENSITNSKGGTTDDVKIDDTNSKMDDSNDDSKKNDSSDDVQAKNDSNTTTDDDYKLTTSTTSTGVKVMWNLKELNNSDYSGLRIIYSSTHTTPKYPGDYSTPPSNPDSYVYLSMAQTGSQVLKLTDGKKYYIRMCSVNREDLKCGDYSDTVVITAP